MYQSFYILIFKVSKMKITFIIFFSLISAIIAFEFFLRYTPFSYGISPVQYDQEIGMWHKKKFTGKIINECYSTEYSFDDKGLIKSQDSYDPNKEDVIIVGDSYTEALMVKNENIIHNQLSRLYSHNYNFLNYSLSGTSPIQHLAILKYKADLSHTKKVIQFINLDTDLYEVDPKNLDPLSRPKVFLNAISLDQYEWIVPANKTFKMTLIDILGDYEMYIFTKKLIISLKDYFHKPINVSSDSIRNTPPPYNWLLLKTALFQTALHIKKISPHTEYEIIIVSEEPKNIQYLGKFLNDNKIKYLLLNDKGPFLQSFPCDGHWNDLTHQKIAQYLFDNRIL